MMIKGQYYLK